jgi:threonine dehydratase
LADVERAARRIAPLISATPLQHSPWLSDLTKGDVWLKLELVQRTGSYKLRGAANAITRLKEQHPDLTAVVTASAGNHGQGVALVAAATGVQVRVYVPAHAPAAKRNALRRLGAEVVETPTYEEAEAQALDESARTGTPYVPPYNHPDIIAGAGTVALEMLRERPDLDAFVVPLGGGGLLSGTAVTVRALAPDAVIAGVEAVASPVFTSALAAGTPVLVDVSDTLADGLAGNMDLDSATFPLVRDLVDRVVAVDEEAIADAMRELILRERLVAEGAGAIAVAAVLAGSVDLRGRRAGIILSGRNVDASVIERILSGSGTSLS